MASFREPCRANVIRTRLLHLSFSVAVGLVFALVLEGGSRLVGKVPGPDNPVSGRFISIFGEHDYLLFWKLKPNLDLARRTVSTNRLGLRSAEIGPKPDEEVRVLSLGESTTLAARLSYDESYSTVLERMLNETESEPHRVINGGVSGYTLFQGFQYLKHRGLELEPDVVLLYFGYNDFLKTAFLARRAERPGFTAKQGLNDWELFERRRRPHARLGAWLMDHSNLYRRFVLRPEPPGKKPKVLRSEDPRVPEEHRRELLRRFQRLCDRQGIRLVVVIPIYRKFLDHVALLREVTAERGLEVVDLPARLGHPLAPDAFFDDVHPKAPLHRRIAREIHAVLSGIPSGGDELRRRKAMH